MTIDLNLPSRDLLTSHVLYSLKSYWPVNSEKLLDLPIPNFQVNFKLSLPLQLEEIAMPAWATDLGINGQLLVPKESVKSSSNQFRWENVDWWLAIFLLLEGWHERLWEKAKGVIHSYSFKLKGWDKRAWEHAWVNRIALFLRRWLCVKFNPQKDILGSLPEAKVILSHDVDAISKTLSIRLKQSAFNFFNFGRNLFHRKFLRSAQYFTKGLTFLFSKEDWWVFNELIQTEKEKGIKAVYNFCADPRPKNIKRWLMDPSYDLSSPRLNNLLRMLVENGHKIGIHPTYDCWENSHLLEKQIKFLEEHSGLKINSCRQHWLRFSWNHTWSAQVSSGIQSDSTLMYNDRAGFRNSSSVVWQPWCTQKMQRHNLNCTTSVLMDSHLYDYQCIDHQDHGKFLHRWIKEIHSVHGSCQILWHPQTLTKDYGWSEGFRNLLTEIKAFSNG